LSAKKTRHYFEYLAFLSTSSFIKSLPAGAVYRLGRILGELFYLFSGKRRRIARTNLGIAFGENKTPGEKNAIIKQSCIQTAVSLLQFIWVGTNTKERVFQLVEDEPEGLDILKETASRGKGVFLLTAHYGNWEIMGLHHGYMNICGLSSIARRLDNPYLEKIVMDLRTISGNQVIHKDESPLRMVRALKNNLGVAVMMDQNAGIGGTFVDFFGKKVSAPRSLAVLSRSKDIPIVPMICYPTKKGRYKIAYGPELKLPKSGDKEKDIYNWTQECEKFLEKIIEKQPEHWLWIHRRWKSRPEEERHLKIYQ
jgi:KDO2-lipid IV(A) lauroyltransferase